MPDTNLPAARVGSRTLLRRGPLDLAPAIAAGGVRATQLLPMQRWVLRGDPGALPVPRDACRTARLDGVDALWLGPDEWLLLAPEGTTTPTAPDPLRGALVDVSHRQGAIRIEGPRATDLLLAGCPQDLDLAPVGYCSRTVLGKAEVVLWRRDEAAWHLEAWRSFLPYIWAFLSETAELLPE